MAANVPSTAARLEAWIPILVLWVVCAVLAAAGLHFYLPAVWNFSHLDAAHYGPFWKAKWWMVAHLGGGSLVLLIGPFQFSGWLRQRYTKVHRWMGRLYLVGVLVGSLAALYMGLWVTQDRPFGIALLYLDLAWVVTTAMAYLAVIRRQFAAHREWMVRSYVVTFAFVVFRLLQEDLNTYHRLGEDAQLVMLVWLAWAVPLLFAEVALQWRRTVGAKRR